MQNCSPVEEKRGITNIRETRICLSKFRLFEPLNSFLIPTYYIDLRIKIVALVWGRWRETNIFIKMRYPYQKSGLHLQFPFLQPLVTSEYVTPKIQVAILWILQIWIKVVDYLFPEFCKINAAHTFDEFAMHFQIW